MKKVVVVVVVVVIVFSGLFSFCVIHLSSCTVEGAAATVTEHFPKMVKKKKGADPTEGAFEVSHFKINEAPPVSSLTGFDLFKSLQSLSIAPPMVQQHL